MRAAFVYANSRSALAREIDAGRAPDTGLLGQNHLAQHGIEALIVEPFLQRHASHRRLAARLAWNAREVLAPFEIRADVLCTALGPLVGPPARLRRGLRTVVFNMSICNRLARSQRTRRRLLAVAIRSIDAVVCFADSQRQRLLDLTGADPARIHVVPLGVDQTFLTPGQRVPENGYVLSVGRDLARDYATLAASVDGLDERVVVVASRRNLVGLRLPANVEVRVDVSATELRGLYEGASCVVVPTRSEAFHHGADCSGQTVVLDALSMARPVVVSDRSTLRGYVDEGHTALVVPPEQPDALRAAIERVRGDHRLADRIGQAGRGLVERELTTRRLAERLAALLSTLET